MASARVPGRLENPDLLFHAVVTTAENKSLPIVSDDTWQCLVDRSHPPAQPKRWFLRLCRKSSMAPASVRVGYTRIHAPGRLGVRHVAGLSCGQATLVQLLQHDGFAGPGCAAKSAPMRSADSARPGDKRVGKGPGR